jgi:hypothetical protein
MGGFFEDFSKEEGVGGDGSYIGKAEKEQLVEDQTPFVITAVEDDDENTFDGRKSPRYVVTVSLGGEERKLGFGKSQNDSSRDRMLAAMQERLATGGDIEPVVLGLVGSFQVLRPAGS